MKRHLELAIIWIPIWVAVFALTKYFNIEYQAFIAPTFLFTFLGVFIGFALTLFVHIVTMVQAIKKKFPEREAEFNRFYQELKDDIMVLVYGIVLFTIIEMIKPLITKNDQILWGKPIEIWIDSFYLSIFIIAIISLYDLIRVSFRVSKFVIDHSDASK